MRYEIDLLNGKGLPVKSRPEAIVIGVATVLVPVIAALMLFGYYVHAKVSVSVLEGQVASCEQRIEEDDLQEVVKLQNELKNRKQGIEKCLAELEQNIDAHFQWSKIVIELVEILPDNMLLTEMSGKQRYVKKKVADPQKPDVMKEVSLPQRSLRLGLKGPAWDNCDAAVKNFKSRVQESEVFGDKVEDMIVSQEIEDVKGEEYAIYFVDCIFRTGLR